MVCDTVKVELEPKPLPDEVPASVIFDNITNYVRQIEVSCPSLSPVQVFARIRQAMENEEFGNLRVLLYPQSATPRVKSSHSSVAAQPQLCSSMGYSMYTAHMPHIQQSTTSVTVQAGTINPMSLTVPGVHFIDVLSSEGFSNGIIDSDNNFLDDYDMVMPYNVMNLSNVVPALAPQSVELRDIYGYGY